MSDCNCTPSGCDPAPLDCQNNEPVQSMVNNFITSIIGTMTKTEVDGQCVWVLPCDLDGAIPGYPREENEGVLCYFRRILAEGIVGEANTGANLGGGAQVFKNKTGVTLNFRSIFAGLNLDIVQTATELTIDFEWADVPADPTDPGAEGQVAYDEEYLYIYSTGGWKRTPIGVW